MAMLGDPDYKRSYVLTELELGKMSKESILYSYIVIKCKFEFPDSIKYPSIPCYADNETTVYPLKGEAVLTGAEYLLAKSQECIIEIIEIFKVPFKIKIGKKNKCPYDGKVVENYSYKPFEDCINVLQRKRRNYPKGTINNAIYKEIGNSIYGLTVKGMSNKMVFDVKSRKTIRINAGELSNPLIASWTTAFIRSVIGELLQKTYEKGGKIVSVTTDGFITNLENLEKIIIIGDTQNEFSLFKEYKRMRFILSGKDEGLELKKTGKGIIS